MIFSDGLALAVLIFSSFALAHAYVIYPLLWWIADRIFPSRIRPPQAVAWPPPRVSVIVAAYNESPIIAARIRNLLESDYPPDALEIVIASDGSSDGTAEAAQRFSVGHAAVRVLNFAQRRGKVVVLNDAVASTTGEILVFSDANVAFEPSAIRRLVERLQDDRVGCVCGKLRFKAPPGQLAAHSEGFYWKMETWLKEREGGAGVLLGANGAIFAMRRSLWTSCPPDTLVEDFYIPMKLLEAGSRVVFEPSALALEDAPPARSDEFSRRIRIGAGDYQALFRLLPLLNPLRGLSAGVFFSHKVLRWFGPFFLVLILGSNIWLAARGHVFFQGLLVLQTAGYTAAVLGLTMQQGHSWFHRGCAVLAHFVSMNAALFLGFIRWSLGRQKTTWRRTRRGETGQAA